MPMHYVDTANRHDSQLTKQHAYLDPMKRKQLFRENTGKVDNGKEVILEYSSVERSIPSLLKILMVYAFLRRA